MKHLSSSPQSRKSRISARREVAKRSFQDKIFRPVFIFTSFFILLVSYQYSRDIDGLLGENLAMVYALSLVIYLASGAAYVTHPILKKLNLFFVFASLFLLFSILVLSLTLTDDPLMQALILAGLLYTIITFVSLILNRYKHKLQGVPKWSIIQTVVIIILSYFVVIQNISISNVFESLNSMQQDEVEADEVCSELDVIESSRNSIVRVVGGGEGSGFFAIEPHHIVTNFHVIENEPAPKVVYSDNTFETAQVVAADKQADIAILKVEKDRDLLQLGDPSLLFPTEEVFALGYPLGGKLNGEVTVKKGYLSARRYSKDVGVEYLQLELPLVNGMSGGPLFEQCGEVVGINTATMSDMGFAISSDSLRQRRDSMFASEDPLKDVEKILIDPTLGPLEAVHAFYSYLKVRKMEDAFALLSDGYKRGYKFETWKKGYDENLDTSIISFSEDENNPNLIHVKLSTKDFVDGDIIYQYFEGTWQVIEDDGKYILDKPSIKEVQDPDYFWFWD